MDDRQNYAHVVRRAVRPMIDLGDISEPESDDSPRRASDGTRRGLRIALMVLIVTFGLAPSAPGRAFLGEPLWTMRASLAGFALGATAVVMSEPGARSIVGRDLLTGTPRWRIPVSAPPQYTWEPGDEVAAVVVPDQEVSDELAVTDERGVTNEHRVTNERPVVNVVESIVTLMITYGGTIVAHVPGDSDLLVVMGGYLLVGTDRTANPVGCAADQDHCINVSAFDTTTGRLVWRLPLTGNVIPSAGGPRDGVSRLAMIQPSGLVELRDPATGDRVSTYPLDVRSGAQRREFLMIGDTLFVAVREEDQAVLTAYPVGPDGHEWTTSIGVSRDVDPDKARFYLGECGRLLCLHADGADNAFDLDTGARRVRVEQQIVGESGNTIVAVPSTEVPGSDEDRRVVYLFADSDGGPIATLADTAPVPWRDGGSRVMLAHQGHGTTDVTVLDASGGSRLLGTVSGTELTCGASHDVLICADPVGLIRAWRLP